MRVSIRSYLLISFFGYTFLVNAQSESILKITGHSEVKVTPDEARLFLNIEGSGADTDKANSEAERKLKSVQNTLKKMGYTEKDLEVSSVNIRDIRKYNEKKPSGYIASFYGEIILPANSLEVTKFIEQLAASATDINTSVQFRISKELKKSKQNDLIAKAINEAQEKAKLIASNVGLSVSGIANIQYGNTPTSPTPMFRSMEMSMDAGAEQGIQFDLKEQTLSESIYIEFILRPDQ